MNKNKPDIKQIKQQIQKTSGQTRPGKPAYVVPEKTVAFDETNLRPTQLVPVRLNRMVAWAVFAFTLIIYMLTQARSLSFWDSGEYATCLSIFSVPHPPGNPFYIVLGRALVALFGGFLPHAWIAAFISALSSAFAVMLTYLITVQLTSMIKIKHWQAIFAGVIASLFTAFSYTFWMNAVEAEVYSGLVLYVNLIIWLTLWWVQHSRGFHNQNYLLLILFLFFIGFSVHQTALQIAPAMLFIVVYPLLLQGSKQENFWLKVIGYGAALILAYVIFGVIGKSLNMDALDQIGIALGIGVIMFIQLHKVLDRRIWLLGIAMIVLGVSAHLYLYIRANENPFISIGHPSTSESFYKYLTRDQYGQTSMFVRRGNFITWQLGTHFLRYFSWQWFKPEAVQNFLNLPSVVINIFGGLLVAFLGLFGALFHFRGNKHSFYYFLAIMLCTTLLMVWVMNLSSEEVRERSYFFVVAYNMWAIWMGIGSLAVVKLFNDKSLRIALIALLTLIPVLNMVVQYKEHDRSRELVALDYGVNILNTLEENAIIFTNGDNDTYPLWYAQAVKDKYAKEFVHPARDVYPTAESQALVDKAMKYKNSQCKGIRKDVSVANLSLLNTSWYLRQLRENEGIKIDFTDEQLALVDTRMGENVGPLRESKVEYRGGDPKDTLKFTIEYPGKDRQSGFTARSFSDAAVINIVKNNYGKRPIYFAVTCQTFVGFDQYLRNEGMANRIVSTPSQGELQLDIDRLVKNIDQVYQYRAIFDNRVFKDDNMTRLIQNYGTGYNRAAVYYAKNGDFKKARYLAPKADRFFAGDWQLTEFYTFYYGGQNQWNKLDQYIAKNSVLGVEENLYMHQKIAQTTYDHFPGQFNKYMGALISRYPYYPEQWQDTDLYVRYYGDAGKWTALDEFVDSNVLPNDRNIPPDYEFYKIRVLVPIADTHPDQFARYVSKLMEFFPEDVNTVVTALRVAGAFGLETQAETAISNSLSKVKYTSEDIDKRLMEVLREDAAPNQQNPQV